MKDKLLRAALAAALMLCSYQPLAAGKEPDAATKSKPAAQAKQGKAAEKLVDINSAGKASLKKLPGIGDAEAERIVAGRPYRSKANLVTRNIISEEVYQGLKRNIMVKPK